MKFNENLIKLRKEKGLSQEELGTKINVARQTISKWELGETTPEMEKLIDLSKIFQISIDELVGNKKYNLRKKLLSIKFEYEYQSKKNIKGIPLVHINFGLGQRKAKALIAIGNTATGLISLGGISSGLISFGGLSGGIISIGAISFGLLFALGGVAIGSLAIGGLALGLYSIGGLAYAINIACGGCARAHIAIGQYVKGTNTILVNNVTPQLKSEIKNTILKEFPNTWEFIIYLYSNLF